MALVVLAALLLGCAPAQGEIALPTSTGPVTTFTLPAVPITTLPTSTTSTPPSTSPATTTTLPVRVADGPVVSVLLVGDVMLGRNVAPMVRDDPAGVFEDVRSVVAGADVAAANLESPLTTRPHIATNPIALEADPASARLLADAGFDLMGLANNHSGDAGRSSILDTIAAVESSGMIVAGAGENIAEAHAWQVMESNGLEIGFLAFDATLAGTPATADSAGIAHWDHDRVRSVVTAARAEVDVLIVGVHGGVEYSTATDPGMEALAADLAGWGVDVVWGHHPHVVQPVYVTAGSTGRDTVVATSLGNFLFDMSDPGTQDGALLEVLADGNGVVAFRVGSAGHPDRRLHFDGWALPGGDAALLGLEWWGVVDRPPLAPAHPDPAAADAFSGGDVTDLALGDATGDGNVDVVVSFRRPRQENGITALYPDVAWSDALGRSAHLGVYRRAGQEPVWVAGTLFRPIARVAVCNGTIALAFDSLDDPTIVAGGAWVWEGFGFTVPAELAGRATPGCSDVDGDGLLDPVIVGRS
jgi:poly-gamma-glutamate synthesis protein (capsule biosynthesis protein)